VEELYRNFRCNFEDAVSSRMSATQLLSVIPGVMDGARPRDHVLVAAADNVQPSASSCRQSCRDTEGCTMWVWCWSLRGCDAGVGAAFPYQGCQLTRPPKVRCCYPLRNAGGVLLVVNVLWRDGWLLARADEELLVLPSCIGWSHARGSPVRV
jgi:hypothetical protein